MRRHLVLAAALAAIVLAITACGSSDSSSSGSGGSGGSGATVSTAQVDGVGRVLVDAQGMALYTPEQEAGGKISCTGSCTAVWVPLTPGSGTPTASGDTGRLAVVTRSDGTRQVTDGGQPLYTFAQDSTGTVTGNGASDSFDGRSFTWHVVLAGGKPASGSATSSGSGGSSTGGSGGNYGGGY